MRKLLAVAVVFALVSAAVVHADPVPGITKASSPLVKTGQTVSCPTCAIMSTAGLSYTDPMTPAHWSSTSGTDNVTRTLDINSAGSANVTLGSAGTITATGRMDNSGILFGDSFTRANGALNATATQYGSATWTSRGNDGQWVVSANRAQVTFSNPPFNTGASLVADTGNADGYLEVTLRAWDVTKNAGLIFRSNAANTQWLHLAMGNTGVIEIYSVVGAPPSPSFTLIASVAGSYAPGDVAAVSYSGTALNIYKNGTLVLTAASAIGTTNTYAGLWCNQSVNGGTKFSDLYALGGVDSRLVTIGGGSTTVAISSTAYTVSIGAGSDVSLRVDLSGVTAASDLTATGAVSGNTLASTVATGTAPLSVTSTTVVPNLNADTLDGISSASFALASALPIGGTAVLSSGTVDISIPNVTACTANDGTSAVAVKVTWNNTTHLLTLSVISGVSTDTVSYVCVR